MERMLKIRDVVRERHADAFLLVNHEYSGQPGTRYLAGFSGSESVLLITENKQFIFTDGRYLSQAKVECPDFELIPIQRSSFVDELEEICVKHGAKKLVVDTHATRHSQILKLDEKLKSATILGEENILQKIRVVKDETELTHLRKSASIACDAFHDLLPHVQEGITEKELAWKLEVLMREKGAEKISFDIIVVSGEHGAKPHGKPSNKKIGKGELVTFDFGCFVNGYASDITRTVALGEVPHELREIYEVVREAQERGCKAARAGISGKELDDVCRNYVASKGYGAQFLHGTGHGVGMEVHELPYVSGMNNEALHENSVITIEPGIYVEGLGGVRIEDALVLKLDGNINLSEKITKKLIVV